MTDDRTARHGWPRTPPTHDAVPANGSVYSSSSSSHDTVPPVHDGVLPDHGTIPPARDAVPPPYQHTGPPPYQHTATSQTQDTVAPPFRDAVPPSFQHTAAVPPQDTVRLDEAARPAWSGPRHEAASGWREPVDHRGTHGSPPAQPGTTARATGSRPDASPWNWLLLVPIVVPLLPVLYNRMEPQLLGLPFFYWCQLAFAFLATGVIAVVHFKVR
jgi:hypothetical protein